MVASQALIQKWGLSLGPRWVMLESRTRNKRGQVHQLWRLLCPAPVSCSVGTAACVSPARVVRTAKEQLCWSIPSGRLSCTGGLLSWSASIVRKISLILRCSKVTPVFIKGSALPQQHKLKNALIWHRPLLLPVLNFVCNHQPWVFSLQLQKNSTKHKSLAAGSKTRQKGWPGCQSWGPVLLPVLLHPDSGDIQSEV